MLSAVSGGMSTPAIAVETVSRESVSDPARAEAISMATSRRSSASSATRLSHSERWPSMAMRASRSCSNWERA